MRAAFKLKGAQPLTQEQQAALALELVWGCTAKMARCLDADALCRERGITDKAKRIDITQAVNARKARL